MNKTITFNNIEIKSEKEPFTFEAIITNKNIDRDNEVLLPEGMDYAEFIKTGTVFYNHDYSMPIAKALKLNKYKDGWKAKVKMAERPADFEGAYFPEYIWSLITQGIIKGVSVGFQVLDARIPSKKDLKDFGDNVRNIITKWRLLEFSIAPLQSNPEAVIIAVNKNMLSKNDAKKYFNIDLSSVINNEEQRKINISVKKNEQVEKRIEREINIQLLKRKGQLYI